MVEIKNDNDELLAVIDNFGNFGKGISFYGTRGDFLQVGKFRYDKDHIMKDHRHIDRPRKTDKTQEIVVMFKGSCEAKIFDTTGSDLVAKMVLEAGDIFILYNGGVGFTVLEDDTVMLEAKNGQYNV